jgi:4-hydroxy-4-methyl-2-oxoglutarate aldolase
MYEHRIVRTVARPLPATVDGLRSAGVSTVYEASGRRGLLPARLRRVSGTGTLAGRAVTVSLPPDDNLMVHAAVERCEFGDVLVVVPTVPSGCAMIGDLLATSLAARGIAGVVVDAGVRDVAALRGMGFPAWSSVVSAAGATKAKPGSVNVPVTIDGVVIAPGDVIVADDDGVVVVRSADAETTLDATRRRVVAEDEKRELFAKGVLGLDMYGLRAVLEEVGVRTVDEEQPEGREAR